MYKPYNIIVSMLCLLCMTSSCFSGTLGDPFRPPNYSNSTPLPKDKDKTWYVNEILASEGRRIAIVNDKTVSAGDTVNGAKVIDITSEQVILKYENRNIYLPLTRVEVKRLIKPGVGN